MYHMYDHCSHTCNQGNRRRLHAVEVKGHHKSDKTDGVTVDGGESTFESGLKALANGFSICFDIRSILVNAVERFLKDFERWEGKRFEHFIQQTFESIVTMVTSS